MTTTAAAKLAAYNRNQILSATPSELVNMLYNRLVLDLTRAEDAQERGDWAVATDQLLHAQAIIAELSGSLDLAAWDGAERQLAIYQYVNSTIVSANINRNVALTKEARLLIEPLQEAWREASESLKVTTANRTGELGVG